jgi:pyrroloquinoline quinone (PQQ) biosynthesis protein C
MAFYQYLVEQTAAERNALYAVPVIRRAGAGQITRTEYLNFLGQAYHHVKHTVPLLMAVGAHLPEQQEWLRTAVAEYIAEEIGHQEWILNDIAACGGDPERTRTQPPLPATELMVAYAYDLVQRVDPLGFFGMVHVLEGTSIAIADNAASAIARSLALPEQAFSYLRSHGALDLDHVDFFKQLMDRIVDPEQQRVILHSARMFYTLYANIFRAVEQQSADATPAVESAA